MSYKIMKLDQKARAEAKRASRDEDERRLAAGEITKQELRRENSFFGALDMSKFRIVAIGGKPVRNFLSLGRDSAEEEREVLMRDNENRNAWLRSEDL
ncbi:hypothetical protein [Rhizobium giardinii]|uniref:hypothetical protein n=1 Tax=Rhizobium giardinii TaxID=56731 RepID=UPI003D6F359A